MHKIERLLQTLAPKGVEFRKLGDIGEFTRGNGLLKSDLQDKGRPVVHYGQIHTQYNLSIDKTISYVNDALFHKLKKAKPNDILIATTSENVKDVGKSIAWLGNEEIAFSGDMYSYSTNENPKFIIYYFQTWFFQKEKEKRITGTKVMRIHENDLKKITIPIPPLEIQQEIVKILDAFTELNTELNTELKARKKQYEYYQNMLLDFKDANQNHKDAKIKTYPKPLQTLLQTLAPNGVEFRKLGDIGEFYGGLVGKSKKSFSQGNKFYVPYVNVFNNPQLDLNALESVQIGDKEKQNTIQLGDVLFTGSSENLEDCAMSCVVTQKIEKDIYLNSFCFGFRFFDKNLFNPSFLKHFLRDYNFRKNISKVANGVTRFNVSKQLLSQITIPIPPLEIQQEIVKILDQFLTLTTDLLAGIPAEIEARKKQYEYYREKLLSFKPLKA
ncbi:restriction endonuclease subunit S [Helicobacter pylori]